MMAPSERPGDRRPRVRCPECGKKLKLPAGKPGKIFRCPVCGGSVIAPLDDLPTSFTEQKQITASALRRIGYKPAFLDRKRYKSFEELADFLGAEYAELARSCSTVLAAKEFSEKEALARVVEMRREKGRRMLDYVKRIGETLGRQIAEIERHPMRRQPEFEDRLRRLQRERRDLAVFLRAVFGIPLPGVALESTPPRGTAATTAQAAPAQAPPSEPSGDDPEGEGPAEVPGDSPEGHAV